MTIATKVTPEMHARLQSIMQSRGMTIYDFLQGCCDIIVGYMDANRNLSPEINRMMQIFEGLKDWNDRLSLTAPDDQRRERTITEAFYLIQKHGQKGCVPVHITGATNSLFRQESYNKPEMLERFIEALFPALYRRLRTIGVEIGTSSITETLLTIVEEYAEDKEMAALRHEFESNDWISAAQQGKARSQTDTAHQAAIRKRDLQPRSLF